MKTITLLIHLVLTIFLVACTGLTPQTPIETPVIDGETFINDLMAQLTMEEKVGQMLQAEKNFITPDEAKIYNIGSILAGGGSHPSAFDDDPDAWYAMVEGFQEAALASSSRIPLLFGTDAVHGHNNAYGATIFPHNINLGMTRDAELIREIGIATAKELKATGIHWNFSPAVSVTEDIRWGRTYESFAEDPSIHAIFVQAYIEGLQSYDVIATAKHFIADGGTANGTDQGDVIKDEAYIRELHLPPYIDAIEAGVASIMISFSSINGVKMHGNAYWIQDVLKDELGFEGIILSDWNATFQLPGDFRTQLASAINAGIDMLMLPTDWKNAHQEILLAVESNLISETRIDEAVTRILRVKYQNNLFTDPFHRLDPETHFGITEHQALARQAAAASYVLLKDEDILPISGAQNIYITGPASDHVGYLSGGWTTFWQGNTSRHIGTGSTIKEALTVYLSSQSGTVVDTMNQADTVIVVFAELPYAEGAGDTLNPSIFGDKAHPDNQAAYQVAVSAKAAGKTVIGVLSSGRPLLLENTLQTFDAFVAVFLPGSEGGPALIDTLYGVKPFIGRLSFTWPASIDYFSQGKNVQTVLFPIGYGLSTEEQD